MLSTSAALFSIAASVESMFAEIVSSWWPYHLPAPAGQLHRFLDASGLQLSSVRCFASYCCGAYSIFALFTSSLSQFFSVSLDCEVHVLHDHHLLSLDFRRCADDGKFVLQLGLQVASVLLSLLVSAGSFLFVTSRGLLGLILVTLSSSSSSLSLSLALCITPCNMSAFTSSMTGPSLLCTENRFG